LEIIATALAEVKVLVPKRFEDARGFFSESYSKRRFAAAGLDIDFIQDNQSLSREKGTIRGLHFQGPPSAQTKLVSCLTGAILDVAVDIRRGSPSFGRHVAVELSAENGRQLLVPRGFAHGFCTLVPHCLVAYKVDAFYDPKVDYGLAYDDPDLGIEWPIPVEAAVLSDKDRGFPRLRDLKKMFVHGE
jgi:dTDP-4-dehydrorhamnose 3,5-epimerase